MNAAGHRGGVDHHAVLLRAHERQRDRDAVQRLRQVAVHQLVDALRRQLVPVPIDDVHAGVVHQDVEPAETCS